MKVRGRKTIRRSQLHETRLKYNDTFCFQLNLWGSQYKRARVMLLLIGGAGEIQPSVGGVAGFVNSKPKGGQNGMKSLLWGQEVFELSPKSDTVRLWQLFFYLKEHERGMISFGTSVGQLPYPSVVVLLPFTPHLTIYTEGQATILGKICIDSQSGHHRDVGIEWVPCSILQKHL